VYAVQFEWNVNRTLRLLEKTVFVNSRIKPCCRT